MKSTLFNNKFAAAFLLVVGIGFTSCQQDNFTDAKLGEQTSLQLPQAPNGLLSQAQLDNYIMEVFRKTGTSVDWNTLPDNILWSGIKNSDGTLTVGYKPTTIKQWDFDNAQKNEWLVARKEMLQLILETEQQKNPSLTLKDILINDDPRLPFLDVKVQNEATISKVRQSAVYHSAAAANYDCRPLEDYIITMIDGVAPSTVATSTYQKDVSQTYNGFGCTDYPAALKASMRNGGVDYFDVNTTVAGQTRTSFAPWNYSANYHGIMSAWGNLDGQGRNVSGRDVQLYILDTGLGVNARTFMSGGAITRETGTLDTYVDPFGLAYAPDNCGHGSGMMGAAAGSRGLTDNTIGVAYGAHAQAYRVVQDVLIDNDAESRGVAFALQDIGDNTLNRNKGRKVIVSMSIGAAFNDSRIKTVLDAFYTNGRNSDKLLFGAAGTSDPLVAGSVGSIPNFQPVFPANHPAVLGVTGVTSNVGGLLSACGSCFINKSVDFSVVMEKHPNYRVNGFFGNIKEPFGYRHTQGSPAIRIGGSSVATATMAGMAALAWQKFPSDTRTALENRLAFNSTFKNNKSAIYGWGITNINNATK